MRKGLGRGLDALIRDSGSEGSEKKTGSVKTKTGAKSKEKNVAPSKKKDDAKKSVMNKKTVKNEAAEKKKDTSEKTSSQNKRPAGRKVKVASEVEAAAKKASTATPAKGDVKKTSTAAPVKGDVNKASTSAPVKEDVKKASASAPAKESVKKPEMTDRAGSFAENEVRLDKAPEVAEKEGEDQVVQMAISLVEPNREQPRKTFDEEAIKSLADSISKFGILQPILVQKNDNYYEIIAGERRWRAALEAGLKEVPVIIKNLSKVETVEIALIENIQREDLNPIEEARAYDRLVREFGLDQLSIAMRVSKNRSTVANSLRLLKLSDEVQQMLVSGELSEGHGRALLALENESLETETAKQVIRDRLTVRQTEKLVQSLLSPSRRKKKKISDPVREAVLNELTRTLENAIGTRVHLKDNGKGKGVLEIEYYSDDELNRIFDILSGTAK